MNPGTPLFLALPVLAVLALGTHPAHGQTPSPVPTSEPASATTDKDKDKPSLRVTLLPVGDFPVSGAIIKDDRPVMVDPPPTELVPSPLYVKDGNDYKSLAVMMNSPSANWTRKVGSNLDILIKKDDGYSTYVSVTLPKEREDVTVFMLRNQPGNDWRMTPRAVVFKNGPESFPLGSVRLINFSSASLDVQIGESEVTAAPRSMKIFPNPGLLNGNVAFTYEVSARIGESVHRLVSTAASYDQKSRMNLVVYDRDGTSLIKLEGDDQPVKIVKYFELPYAAPAPASPGLSASAGSNP